MDNVVEILGENTEVGSVYVVGVRVGNDSFHNGVINLHNQQGLKKAGIMPLIVLLRQPQ